MGIEESVGEMTRQKDISSKKEGRAIKEDYIILSFFSYYYIFSYYTKNIPK